MKAYLIFKDIELVRSHNLLLLLDLISQHENISDEFYDQANMLQQFAVDIRYPEINLELTEEDIKKSISISKFFREHILKLMSLEM